jgi:FkbM family methyltransferase
MTVVDIGANVGSYTTQLRQLVGPTGTVIAIEPQAALIPGLHALGATVIHAAVTDHEGTVILHHSRQTPHASLTLANVLEPTGTSEAVRGVTLDGLQRSGELPMGVAFLKVDTQGAEAAVVRGAAWLMRTQAPIWYLELWAQGLVNAGDSVPGLCALGEASGYTPEGTWAGLIAAAAQHQGHGSIDMLWQPKGPHGVA